MKGTKEDYDRVMAQVITSAIRNKRKPKRNGCPHWEECPDYSKGFEFCVICRLTALYDVLNEMRQDGRRR